jgi:hypothetical protein
MLVVSLFLVSEFITIFFTNFQDHSLASLDWAGYVAVSDFANPEPLITGVAGSWTVPQVNVSLQNTFSAAWIGIGGQLDNTLIQTGTEHDSINGEATYSVWYELLPNDSVAITTINVSVGDEIQASISLADSGANEWSIEIVDLTKEQSFEINVFYDSSRLSAEWIVERPTVNNILSQLADFGSVTFTNSNVTINNVVGSVGNFAFFRTIMQNRQNVPLVTVSSLSSDGSKFTVKYLDTANSMQIWITKSMSAEFLRFPYSLAKGFSLLIGVCHSFTCQDTHNLRRRFFLNYWHKVNFFSSHYFVGFQY